MDPQGIILSERSQSRRVLYSMTLSIRLSKNGKTIEMENRLVVPGVDGSKQVSLYKVNRRNPCGGGNVLHLDCTDVNILVTILRYSFARCY